MLAEAASLTLVPRGGFGRSTSNRNRILDKVNSEISVFLLPALH